MLNEHERQKVYYDCFAETESAFTVQKKQVFINAMFDIKSLKHKILIVDEHPIVRHGLSQLIKGESDLEVCCEAKDISDALKCISACIPALAIVDISFGHNSAIRVIENFSHKYPGISILVFSMHDESLYAERCLRAGAKGYIMKKEPPEKVLLAIRMVLDGKISVSDNLASKLLRKFVAGKAGVCSTPIERLSNRELEVFRLIGQGVKTRNIAEQLNLSVKTIETYIDHIKKKMGFKDCRNLFLNAVVHWNLGEDSKSNYSRVNISDDLNGL